MMNIRVVAGAVTVLGCIGISGCSVVKGLVPTPETTKSQLESGVQDQVNSASRNISTIVLTGHDASGFITYTEEEQEAFLAVAPLDLQEKLLFDAANNCYRKAPVVSYVAQHIDYSKVKSLARMLEAICNYHYGQDTEHLGRVYYGETQLQAIRKGIVDNILATMTEDQKKQMAFCEDLKGWGCHWVVEPLQRTVIDKCSSVADQELLVDMLKRHRVLGDIEEKDGGAEKLKPGQARKGADSKASQPSLATLAVGKITDRKCKAKLLNDAPAHMLVMVSHFTPTELAACVQGDGIEMEDYEWEFVAQRIGDETMIAKILAQNKGSAILEKEKAFLSFLKNQKLLAALSLQAQNGEIGMAAAKKVSDPEVIRACLARANAKNEKIMEALIGNLKHGSVDYALYQSVSSEALKKELMGKLSSEALKKVRESERAACEELIAKAGTVSGDYYTLGGFHLGMSVDDAEKLVGYYIPDCTVYRSPKGSGTRLKLTGQAAPFCLANKEGKVWLFNFNAKLLQKILPLEADGTQSWGDLYGKQAGLKWSAKIITESPSIYDSGTKLSYPVFINQTLLEVQDAKRKCKIQYFTSLSMTTALSGVADELIKERAREKYADDLGVEGSLRAVQTEW